MVRAASAVLPSAVTWLKRRHTRCSDSNWMISVILNEARRGQFSPKFQDVGWRCPCFCNYKKHGFHHHREQQSKIQTDGNKTPKSTLDIVYSVLLTSLGNRALCLWFRYKRPVDLPLLSPESKDYLVNNLGALYSTFSFILTCVQSWKYPDVQNTHPEVYCCCLLSKELWTFYGNII